MYLSSEGLKRLKEELEKKKGSRAEIAQKIQGVGSTSHQLLPDIHG